MANYMKKASTINEKILYKQYEERIEILKKENNRLVEALNKVGYDRLIFRDALTQELKYQLSCKGNDYYTPKTIIERIMNTISKAEAFSINLK